MTTHHAILVNGALLHADVSGVLWWPDRRALFVADLHLEKGSAFAARRRGLLPPYDTLATLIRLEAAIARLQPAMVVSLGDSIHDCGADGRIGEAERARVAALTGACEWIWVAGNHDPEPPAAWGGQVAQDLTLGPLHLRHISRGTPGEVTGHFHPKAAVSVRARRVTARCFVHDGRHAMLPAFGAYTGGLNVLSEPIARLFDERMTAILLGERQMTALPRGRLVW